MASPAKNWNAYRENVCTYTQVPVPARKLINHEKRENQQNERVATGVDPKTGRACTRPTKNYD